MKIMRFIIVDDDMLDINLCKLYLKHTSAEIEIIDFNIPVQALTYLQNEFSASISIPTILFLDINMNTMTAWEFLEVYDRLNEAIKNRISIYIVSSSIDSRDKEKANNNNYVKGYLVKPITAAAIKKVCAESGQPIPFKISQS